MEISKEKIREAAHKLYESINPHVVCIGENDEGIVMLYTGRRPTEKEKSLKEFDGVPIIAVKYIGPLRVLGE